MKRLLLTAALLLVMDAAPVTAQIVRGTQFVFGTAALTASRRVLTGAGSPEAVVTAPVGAVYLRTNGGSVTTAYLKESGVGNTGWIAVASTSGALAQFAATTSAQLAGVISDETGSGLAVFGTSATLTTPTIAGAITFPDGVRQTLNPDGTNAGINVGSQAGDPASPANGDLWYDSTANELTGRINGANVALGAGGGSGAPTDATYLTQTANATLSAEQAIGALASGIMRVNTTDGVVTSLTTSAGVFANISDETGSGVLAGSISPSFTTPTLGVATATSLDTAGWTINATDLVAKTGGGIIEPNTSDGSDTARIIIAGGGASSTSRGSWIQFKGNEFASEPGYVDMRLAAVTGSRFRVLSNADATNASFYDTGAIFFPNISAGAAGDTDLCLNSTTNELTDAGASTCVVSSLRFKSNWQPLPLGQLAKVLRLTPGSFHYTNDARQVARIGLTAENMHVVEPRLAFYEPDGVTPRGVAYEETVALLTAAIQELAARVAVLEAR